MTPIQTLPSQDDPEVQRIAKCLVKAHADYLTALERFFPGKADNGWRALDQMVKDNGGSRAAMQRNLATRLAFSPYGILYHTPEQRAMIAAAWPIAKKELNL